MSSNEQPTKTNYLRRILGAILCLLPLEAAVASLIVGLFGQQRPFFPDWHIVASEITAIAIALFNLYLSLIRPWIHQLIHRSREGYRYISGAPMVGNILVVVGVVAGFGSIGIALLAIVATILNTGDSLWFLIWTWKDKSLWDR